LSQAPIEGACSQVSMMPANLLPEFCSQLLEMGYFCCECGEGTTTLSPKNCIQVKSNVHTLRSMSSFKIFLICHLRLTRQKYTPCSHVNHARVVALLHQQALHQTTASATLASRNLVLDFVCHVRRYPSVVVE
jgi:hypothetical protein